MSLRPSIHELEKDLSTRVTPLGWHVPRRNQRRAFIAIMATAT